MKANGRTWAVVWVIHVNTPYQYIPKLFIKNVPPDFNKQDVKEWLEGCGYQFGEFGIPWANHSVGPINEYPASVQGAYRRGEVERIAYGELEPID